MDNINLILPEIAISLSIMFLLVFGVFKKNSENIIHNLSIGSLIVTAILIFNNPFETNIYLFKESYIIDYLSSFMKNTF